MKENEFLAKLRKSYAEQLKRREQEILRLKKENQLLMHTALKQSENTARWMEYARKLEAKAKKEK